MGFGRKLEADNLADKRDFEEEQEAFHLQQETPVQEYPFPDSPFDKKNHQT